MNAEDQAFYRQSISAAKKELASILEFRKPDHKNFPHWHKANKWVLVGNFKINSNDEAAWNQQIVGEFRKIGLESEFWSLEKLDSTLVKHPEIQEIFFGEENRVLLGLKETQKLLNHELVGDEPLEKPFLHRTTELATIVSFSSDPAKAFEFRQ